MRLLPNEVHGILRLSWFRALLANAVSLVGTSIVTSGLGVVFWWFAARQFSAGAVGLAAAEISAMTLLGTLSMLGLGTMLIAEMPNRAGREGALISAALLVSGGVGAAVGLVFAVVAPWLFPGFADLGAGPWQMGLFAAGVALTALTLVLDQILVGLLRGHLQLARNAVFSVVKLGALALSGIWVGGSALAIWWTWVLGNAVSVIGLGAYAGKSGADARSTRPDWRLLRGLGRAAISHHALNSSVQFQSLAMPLVVTIVLSAEMNAYFYTANMIASFISVAPIAMATALFAVGAREPGALERKLRFTMALSAAAVAAANVVVFLAAEPMLQVFGAAYAQEAAWSLRLLSLLAFPRIVLNNYLTLSRVRGRVLGATTFVAISSVFELAAAAIGARLDGLVGLSIGWLVMGYLQAAVLAPSLLAAAGLPVGGWPARLGRRVARGGLTAAVGPTEPEPTDGARHSGVGVWGVAGTTEETDGTLASGARPTVVTVPVLMYHSVSSEGTRPFLSCTMPPREFAEQMEYLHRRDYTPITVSAFVRAIAGEDALPANPIVLTFDDGYADFYTDALPVLQQYGFAATLYLVAGYIGGTARWLRFEGEADRPLLTWSQLQEIAGAGIECGAHSLTHAALDTLPGQRAWDEIRGSKQVIEDRIGQSVTTFAYPFGHFDAAIRAMVGEAGFTSACSVTIALSSLADDPLALARIVPMRGAGLGQFTRLVAGRGLPVAPTRVRWQRRARNGVRRGLVRAQRRLGAEGLALEYRLRVHPG